MSAPAPRVPRGALLALIIVNAIVLTGQIWPEGAPPFARAVNIAFLAATLILFAWLLVASSAQREDDDPRG